ncbi:hypothetical protein DFH08DRAFT_809087 [Mycena albidolilacea]|uniref:Uncharacterized protein n=1 Tax=Mycena albidolilacea TaxID=1033008 RepID=A0AAD7A0Y8_9AGAR|nr:hypothetical protein DFH08DRAFT_809087 [Mycena albidolilacea]
MALLFAMGTAGSAGPSGVGRDEVKAAQARTSPSGSACGGIAGSSATRQWRRRWMAAEPREERGGGSHVSGVIVGWGGFASGSREIALGGIGSCWQQWRRLLARFGQQ